MIILVVYLTLKDLVSLFGFINVNIVFLLGVFYIFPWSFRSNHQEIYKVAALNQC